VRCSSAAFPKIFLQVEIGTALAVEEEKCKTAAFHKLFMFRKAGTQVSLVIMSHPLPENCCSTSLFTTGYKRLTEGEHEAFCFWLLLLLF
jgi:hypothetical protein